MSTDQEIKALYSLWGGPLAAYTGYVPGLGIRVAATARAHAAGDVNTFTVAGGYVLINLLYGIVTIEGAGATTITVGCNPTIGTTVVYAVAVDIDALVVGDPICFNYVAGTLTTVLDGVSGKYQLMAQTGTIFVRGGAALGTSQWNLYYLPITAGATIVTV